MLYFVDIGAPKSLLGQKELHRIVNLLVIHHRRLLTSQNIFGFSDATYESFGISIIPLETLPVIPLTMVQMDLVSADIPDLLRMDILYRESITPCTVSNILIHFVTVKGKMIGTYMLTNANFLCDELKATTFMYL